MVKKLGNAAVFIVGDLSGLNKALGQAQAMTKRTIGNIQSMMTSIGTNMTALGAGIGAGLGWVGKMGIDAVESENLFSVSFGKMQEAAREWSKELSRTLGINQYDARETAATYNAMLKSMGQTEEAALKMSEGLVQLGYDMSSFYNLKPEEAFEKLRAGISGESEPLKQLGILVSDTEVKAFALANGIGKLTGGFEVNAEKIRLTYEQYRLQARAIIDSKRSADEKRVSLERLNLKVNESIEALGAQKVELSETDKVAARYGLIMERTALAQGDLARTIDSPANQLRIMRERMNETATTIGTTLVPAIGEILKTIQPVVSQMSEWVIQNPDLVKSLALSGASFAAFNLTMGPALITGGKFLGWGFNTIGMTAQLSQSLAALSGGGLLGFTKGLGAIVGTAGLGWAFGRWIDEMTKNTTFGEWIDGIADSVVKVTDSFRKWFGLLDSNAGKLKMDNESVQRVIAAQNAGQPLGPPQSKAHGGEIHASRGVMVGGFGGKTEDNIPAWLSAGEIVLPNVGVKPAAGVVDAAIARLSQIVGATRGDGGRSATVNQYFDQSFVSQSAITPQSALRIMGAAAREAVRSGALT